MSEPAFGAHVLALRRARGLLQRDLADRVDQRLRAAGGRGFVATYLSKIERDRVAPPSRLAVEILAAELGADPFDLVARSGHVPAGLERLVLDSRAARQFLRGVVGLNLTADDWSALRALAERLAGR